ncbi:MATE family efflux transporter [Geofilum sp. OHC36d9]|uniref:MATE family efflux transporter n=1 Tax=Geofilum sp. OHC36d9 TaxID=3458413 RepID=UPI0040344F7B
MGHLFRLAVPTIGASFMQMTYNLTDMLWLGRLGENAVAAVGAAGFFVWLGISVLLITRVGAEVGVSQALGRKDTPQAMRFVRHALLWAIIITAAMATVTYIFAPSLIRFFGISSVSVNTNGAAYLRIVSLAFIFSFVNPTFSGIYNGMGNSRLPFWYMTIGVGLNLVLDPLLIFGWKFVPAMGIEGAAWATFGSQMIVFVTFVYRFVIKEEMGKLHLRQFNFDRIISRRIFSLGLPVAAESGLFAIFGMILARFVAQYGPVAIAVQSIGGQVEALSWMTASGFATALGSFTGQNFGAGFWDRIRKGYRYTLFIGTCLALPVSLVFIFFGDDIYSLFFDQENSQYLGGVYLSILSVSQLFMVYEITTRGAFNGVGRTIPPALTGIIFTGLRIPLAYVLMQIPTLGLFGIWWAISITSVFKGTISPLWFRRVLNHHDGEGAGFPASRLIVLLPSRLRQQWFIKKK